ncbi:putative Rna pseudouridine synthase [Cardiosporidium cionae]|uniref:Rna pseudouridine synthase n=1 Tax=Cardiosporidium cionae TaxID=476202 RepID=A0ABQ7J6R6_9APIC|nr:putative Rna pseudouridine synthase [Cardiosporidium cionae]|eukprot:KAF8819686.1 putative Rna pseudouridine synthase [Cardiosporidium cionae]
MMLLKVLQRSSHHLLGGEERLWAFPLSYLRRHATRVFPPRSSKDLMKSITSAESVEGILSRCHASLSELNGINKVMCLKALAKASVKGRSSRKRTATREGVSMANSSESSQPLCWDPRFQRFRSSLLTLLHPTASLSRISPHMLTVMAWCVATLRFRDYEMMHAVAQKCIILLTQQPSPPGEKTRRSSSSASTLFSAVDLATLCWSFTVFHLQNGLRHRWLLPKLSPAFVQEMHKTSLGEISKRKRRGMTDSPTKGETLRLCRTLLRKDIIAIFFSVPAVATPSLSHFDVSALSLLLWAYVSCGHADRHSEFCLAIEHQLRQRLSSFEGKHFCHFVWSMTSMGLSSRRSTATFIAVVEEVERRLTHYLEGKAPPSETARLLEREKEGEDGENFIDSLALSSEAEERFSISGPLSSSESLLMYSSLIDPVSARMASGPLLCDLAFSGLESSSPTISTSSSPTISTSSSPTISTSSSPTISTSSSPPPPSPPPFNLNDFSRLFLPLAQALPLSERFYTLASRFIMPLLHEASLVHLCYIATAFQRYILNVNNFSSVWLTHSRGATAASNEAAESPTAESTYYEALFSLGNNFPSMTVKPMMECIERELLCRQRKSSTFQQFHPSRDTPLDEFNGICGVVGAMSLLSRLKRSTLQTLLSLYTSEDFLESLQEEVSSVSLSSQKKMHRRFPQTSVQPSVTENLELSASLFLSTLSTLSEDSATHRFNLPSVVYKPPSWLVNPFNEVKQKRTSEFLPFSRETVATMLSSTRPEPLQEYLRLVHPTALSENTLLTSGILHRLDLYTSGTVDTGLSVFLCKCNILGPLLVAKTLKGYCGMRLLLEARVVEKSYLCLVHGRMPLGKTTVIQECIETEKNGHKGTLTSKISSTGKSVSMHMKGCEAEALSVIQFSLNRVYLKYVKYIQMGDFFSLCRVRIFTGRTHQIRVHMRAHGYPIVGDGQYMDDKAMLERDRTFCWRPFLHCESLYFEDLKEKKHHINCALPADLTEALQSLESISMDSAIV